MLDKNTKIAFPDGKYAEIDFNGEKVLVKSYLSLLDMGILTQEFMEGYFSESPTRVLESEYKLALALLDQCTNIEVNEKTVEGILSNFKLLEQIRKSVANYGEFRHLLKLTVEEKKEQIRLENSLPMVIRNITDKAMEFLNGLEDLDFTDEKISQLKGLIDYANESPILKESIDIFKKGKEKAE